MRKSEQANGADFPIPKLPPDEPPFDETPEAFTRFCHGELYSLSEPVSPVVLKSLMRSMGILSDSERFSALVKKSTVFLLPCSFQKLRQDLKASLRESNCFISPGEMYDKENSTLTGLPGSSLASREFWHISLARERQGEPLKVSIPASPIPLSVPKLLPGKFQSMLIISTPDINGVLIF